MSSARADDKSLKPKSWVQGVWTEHTVSLQRSIIHFLLVAYSFLLAATFTIFFFQGFGIWGFCLDPELLHWLGGATIGEIGGLLALTVGAVFKNRLK